MRFANFPTPWQLEDFDFSAQPSIDEKLVRELAAGAYLADATNVLFIGPPGSAKPCSPSSWAGQPSTPATGSTTPPPLT